MARVATAAVPRTGSPVVVELGPGTGAFTKAIQRRLAGRGWHIAVEVNPRFARRLAALPPAVDVVNGDATDLATVLALRGLSQADVVVCGLPWAAFTEHRPRSLLSTVVAALPPPLPQAIHRSRARTAWPDNGKPLRSSRCQPV